MEIYPDELAAARATASRMAEKVQELEVEREERMFDELDRLRAMVERIERTATDHLLNCRLLGSGARGHRSGQSVLG